MHFTLEIIGFNIESCLLAQAAGAHRIELCDNPGEGGTTPSLGFIKAARKILRIPLYPIIRPRGGDFLYSEPEFEVMKTDIRMCREEGCDGVVIGMLHADGAVDKKRCGQLVELAYPMGVSFHRAFDRAKDAFTALEDIIETGCERILTSGQKPNAMDGVEMIKSLIQLAQERIIIMPGSGIRADNIVSLAERTGAVEFHSSARNVSVSKMEFINSEMKESLQTVTTHTPEIEAMIRSLKIHSDRAKQVS